MKNRRLDFDDVRQVVRLICDAFDLNAGEIAQLHLLEGMCRILHARVATAGLVTGLDRRAFEISCAGCVGVSASEATTLFSPYRVHGAKGDPLLDNVLRQPRVSDVRVHRRRDLVSDADWYRHAIVADVRVPLHLDDTIHAYRAFGRGAVLGVQIVRDTADGPFDERDCNLVELIMLEAQDRLVPLAPAGPHLTPRERQTLACLLSGDSEKQVADKLRISIHTVHDHVKHLYRAFDVASRSELMARVLAPDPDGPRRRRRLASIL